MKQILSDIMYLDRNISLDTENIESILKTNYGSLIRWAIVGISDNNIKICVTYEKGE